jgi:hypothetical protein
MEKVTFEQIAQVAEKIKDFQPEDSFMLSYREFITYFASLESITPHNLIIGSHFTYGWMPRQLELKKPTKERLAETADVLNEVKKHGRLSGEREKLLFLKGLINNSLVGTSKLLHFVNPHVYAIWDRRVYRYINQCDPHDYQINDVENYLAYLKNCEEIVQDERFKQIHIVINGKVGYEVTPYRAVELIMFENSKSR